MNLLETLTQSVPNAGPKTQALFNDAEQKLQMLESSGSSRAGVIRQQLADAISKGQNPSGLIKGLDEIYYSSLRRAEKGSASTSPAPKEAKGVAPEEALAQIENALNMGDERGIPLSKQMIKSAALAVGKGDMKGAAKIAGELVTNIEDAIKLQNDEDKEMRVAPDGMQFTVGKKTGTIYTGGLPASRGRQNTESFSSFLGGERKEDIATIPGVGAITQALPEGFTPAPEISQLETIKPQPELYGQQTQPQGSKPTTKMTAEQVANLASQGFKVNAFPTDDGNFIVSGATVGGGSGTTFDFDPKTGRVTVTQGGSKAGQAAKAEEKAKLTATGLTQDLFELKRRYSNLSAGTGPIPALSRLGASAVYGTPAYGVKEIANRVTDGLTIENIMSARRSNASGAALGGSTSDKDMQIYKNATTSINAAQNPEEFNREWTRLMEAQLNIVYGTPEQRANLVKENKITEEYNKQIEDLYPDETINMKGQLVPRVKTTTPNVKSPITSETQAILDRYGKGQ